MHKNNKEHGQTYSAFFEKSKKLNLLKKTSIYKRVLKMLNAHVWEYKIMAAITQAPSLPLLWKKIRKNMLRI